MFQITLFGHFGSILM
ncbi:unnamed protein product [Timema podura]|uniref:Uncharacterized protein n=1 Tax=Timema podura TaxID=61482 RepID=A0ABN7PQ41_TIMPD|nr:unnamed protein product [Timema podura]